MPNHKYFSPPTICFSSFWYLEMRSCILEQLKSKFIRTCNSDLTVVSLRRFLSLLHCVETRENTFSTNALLTGIENTMLTNLHMSRRESFSDKSFIDFVSGPSSLNVSSGIFWSIPLRAETSSNNSSAIATRGSICFANSFTSSYLTFRFSVTPRRH